jgi:hypothetical protein
MAASSHLPDCKKPGSEEEMFLTQDFMNKLLREA